MNVIRILPEKVAAQIAAGEVIERPASVVRELLDNSIDAGSDRITVKIEKGGKGLIRVRDNGVGMSRDDLLLSLERYATSKIKSASDLFSIETLGFRGEALPSASAVSRMEITSRPAEQLIGYRVKVDGGKLRSLDETGCPAGTIVEVRDLFFNMPARRKFLRAEKTETDHIIDTVSRIALPFLHIDFRLDDAERTILNLPVSEKDLNRLTVLMGRNVAGSMVDLNQKTGELRVKAYLAPADLSRSRGDRIFIYVNNRSIRDRLVMRAVIEGYGQRLMKGRYPQAVIFIEVEPSLVDINVHPTKQEIRFRQSRLVYQTIISAIESTLAQRFHSILDAGFDNGHLEFRGPREKQITGMAIAEPRREYSGTREERVDYPQALFQEEELEHFGGSTFLLRSVPSILVNAEWENFLFDLIPVLEKEDDLSSDKAMDKLMTIMACHGAIKAGKRMSQEEMTLLLNQLEDMDLPTNCPHGRPIFKRFSYYEIEKMFKRVV